MTDCSHHLDIQKIDALKEAEGNCDGKMTLDETLRDDINWWITHLDSEFAYMKTPEPSFTLCTDASLDGWGVTLWEAECVGWSNEQTFARYYNKEIVDINAFANAILASN